MDQQINDQPINMYPQAHLLGIALELRQEIYAHIVESIQRERPTLRSNPVSNYDGLRLTCKKLHDETQESVFFFSFTSRQTNQIQHLRPNKDNFLNIRSISIEIPFDLGQDMYKDLGSFLDRMQLSIQQLRLFFIGSDRRGRQTRIWGCGKKKLIHNKTRIPCLRDSGQDVGDQWTLLRRLAILRNLRILQIENANIPVSQGLIYNSKPSLRAVSVTSDPRSVASSFSRMSDLSRRHLYRNIRVKPERFPPVETLALDANSASNVEGMINGVDETLRHLSWRVPNPDLQPDYPVNCFYAMTDRLIQTLSTRATRLETLRLCISVPQYPTNDVSSDRDINKATVELDYRLPLFHNLKHLEIHFTGKSYFFHNDLIGRLPPALSRLYISDRTVPIARLVKQVRKRYFTYSEDDVVNDAKEAAEAAKMLSQSPCETWNHGHTQYYQQTSYDEEDGSEYDFLENEKSAGEIEYRRDDIPLAGGNLGFVNYEYDCGDSENGVRAMIMKLNGQLLDREFHLGLAYTQGDDHSYGIVPHQEDIDSTILASECPETATSSQHDDIYAAIYDIEETAPKKQVVEKNKQELTEFLGENWYFGNEDEAMKIFKREPVARAEGQRQKAMMDDVEVVDCHRCRWASPDFELTPVGCCPVPKLPYDWKDSV